MYLKPLSFYSNFKKSTPKLKKTQNIENGEFDKKSAQNKKDVKFDFTSDMFYKIFCIFNNINFISGIFPGEKIKDGVQKPRWRTKILD